MSKAKMLRPLCASATRALSTGARFGGYYGNLSKEQPYFSPLSKPMPPPSTKGMLHNPGQSSTTPFGMHLCRPTLGHSGL